MPQIPFLVVIVGTLSTMIGSFLAFYQHPIGFWIYGVGVLLLLIFYFLAIPTKEKLKVASGKNSLSPKARLVNARRLHRIGFIGVCFLAAALYLLFRGQQTWLVLFFIGSILHLWYILRS